jgi:hypothetical protein
MARTFLLTTPAQHGEDIRELQQELNRRLEHWGIKLRVKTDGVYGVATKRAAMTVAYGLGIDRSDFADGVQPDTRSKIRHAGEKDDLRSTPERERARKRRDWVKRLAKRYSRKNGGVAQAVAYARKMVGTEEQPPGSNLGPRITDWEVLAGYPVRGAREGVFWCGCFVNACLVAGGFPTQASWGIGFVPNIEHRAKAEIDGWKWHGPGSTPQAGWVACFGNGDHTEFVAASGKPLRTVGGNTSKGDGSPNNGGGVFAHDFSKYRGLPLDGYAEPPWNTL